MNRGQRPCLLPTSHKSFFEKDLQRFIHTDTKRHNPLKFMELKHQ